MKTIDTSFDLNLLRVLVMLASTRNVTQAALALNMSQSGFSTALARLRRDLDDPVFIRTAAGMRPTPRAEQAIAAAQEALARVAEAVLQKPGFDPRSSRTVFRLAMMDVAEIVFLPRLLAHLQQHAPHVTVRSVSMDSEPLKQAMAQGDVDLALGYFPDLDSDAAFQQKLYSHTFACMVRRGHPLAVQGITERSYVEIGHVTVSSPSRSSKLFDRFLERKGLKPRIVLQTPHHLSLPSIVEATNLLATIPLATGARFAKLGMIELLPLPFAPPNFAVQQHWHPLMHHDASNQWLRQQVAQLFNAHSNEWQGLQDSLYSPQARSSTSATRGHR